MPKAIFAGQEGASQLARHALEKVTFLQTGGPTHTTAIKSSLGRHLLSQHPLNPFDGSIITKKFISRALPFTCEARRRENTVGGIGNGFCSHGGHKIALSLFKVYSPKQSIKPTPFVSYNKNKPAIKKLKINPNFYKY